MRVLIGYNMVCFAITSLIILIAYDGDIREKIRAIIIESVFMSLFSIGVWLMVG